SFDAMTAFTASPLNLTDAGEPMRVLAASVTDRFADTLRVAPQIGRAFTERRERGGDAPSPLLLSDPLWRTPLPADSGIVGRGLRLDGAVYSIAGVMPADFSFPRELLRSRGARVPQDVDVWIPLRLRPGYRANAFLQVVARLKAEVSIAQARAEMTAIESRLGAEFVADRGAGVLVEPLQERLVSGV